MSLIPAELQIGQIVMVGPSTLPSGAKDRSWTDAIWMVEGITGPYVLCKRISRLSGYADVIMMRSDERDWYDATKMFDDYCRVRAELAEDRAVAGDEVKS